MWEGGRIGEIEGEKREKEGEDGRMIRESNKKGGREEEGIGGMEEERRKWKECRIKKNGLEEEKETEREKK